MLRSGLWLTSVGGSIASVPRCGAAGFAWSTARASSRGCPRYDLARSASGRGEPRGWGRAELHRDVCQLPACAQCSRVVHHPKSCSLLASF